MQRTTVRCIRETVSINPQGQVVPEGKIGDIIGTGYVEDGVLQVAVDFGEYICDVRADTFEFTQPDPVSA